MVSGGQGYENRSRGENSETAGLKDSQCTVNEEQGLNVRRAGVWLPGATAGDGDGSRRAFLKEFHKVVEAADVVIEVLDARDPAGTRCADVERAVLRAGAGGQAKHLILLLNKIGAHSC